MSGFNERDYVDTYLAHLRVYPTEGAFVAATLWAVVAILPGEVIGCTVAYLALGVPIEVLSSGSWQMWAAVLTVPAMTWAGVFTVCVVDNVRRARLARREAECPPVSGTHPAPTTAAMDAAVTAVTVSEIDHEEEESHLCEYRVRTGRPESSRDDSCSVLADWRVTGPLGESLPCDAHLLHACRLALGGP